MVQLLYPGITKGAGARPPQLVQRDQAAPAFIESFRAVVGDGDGMIASQVTLLAAQVLAPRCAQGGHVFLPTARQFEVRATPQRLASNGAPAAFQSGGKPCGVRRIRGEVAQDHYVPREGFQRRDNRS